MRCLGMGRRAVLMTLVVSLWSVSECCGQSSSDPPRCRFPVLDNDAAWQRLPASEENTGQPLPTWARALAGPLPRTTAALLELDHLYRTSDAFDPALRAAMRWVAARANQCAYSQAYAEMDLRRAGLTPAQIEALEASIARRPPAEQAALRFARKLTLAASTVTDEEVAELLAAYGEQQVTAMVLQLAYANYFDRLVLALGLEVEPTGPLAPLAVRFTPAAPDENIAAPRTSGAAAPETAPALSGPAADWTSLDFAALRRGMEQQRHRTGRIAVPAWEQVRHQLPAGLYPSDRPIRVKWTLVVLGYQPALGSAWLKAMRTFGRESQQDRVFQETLFWVITRTLDCFY